MLRLLHVLATDWNVTGLKRIELCAWGLGLGLVALYVGIRGYGTMVQGRDLERFEQARRDRPSVEVSTSVAARAAALDVGAPTDFSLWSDQRIEAYRDTLGDADRSPIAVLRIPKVGLEVAVLEGTDDFALDRAVGHIEGTAQPGEAGNVAIAGHRDGFFRGLKDVARGDRIELETLDGTDTYVIDDLSIVDPDQVEVLGPTVEPAITLVTCYPFYYVGSAPKRFIVRGVLAPLHASARLGS